MPEDAAVDVPRFESACGRVTATGPTGIDGDVYWRLEYHQHGKRKQTTGGRTERKALEKMASIIGRLDSDSESKGTEKLGVVLDMYYRHLDDTCSLTHAMQTKADLSRALGHLTELRSEVLERRHLVDALNEVRHESSLKNRKSRCSAFLKFGRSQRFFTRDQARLLEDFVWAPVGGRYVREKRKPKARVTGESERYVTADEVPVHSAVATIGKEFDVLLPRYGRLMIEHAAISGYRSGELFAVDSPSIDLDKRDCRVDWQILSISGLPTRKARPKGGIIRVTNFPDVTPTGFALHDALTERLAQVEFEYEKGTNPKRLLYPAPKGDWWWATGFVNDFYAIAAEAAGFERLEWIEIDIAGNKKVRREWVHTMHSLRHRFARDRIDIYGHTPAELQAVGGWEDAGVLWTRYYGKSKDLVDSSSGKLRDR